MKEELDKQLCEKYPKIFKNRNASEMESCFHWGFEHSDGWYDIIETLCEAASGTYSTSVGIDREDAEKHGIKESFYDDKFYFSVNPPQMVADQVKEKFGTLRFYYHLEFDPVLIELNNTGKYPDIKEVMDRYHAFFDGIIHMAEIMSERTCEITGKKGELCVRGGWYKTLCEEKAKELEYTQCRLINRDDGIIDLNNKTT